MPRRLAEIVGLLVLLSVTAASAQESAELGPDEAASLAVDRSPSVAAAATRLEIARGARARSAFLRGNPQANSTFDPAAGFFALQAYQPFSMSAEGWIARAAAREAIAAAEASVKRARFEAAASARRAWAAAASARARVGIAEEGVTLAHALAEAFRRRCEAGEASKLAERLAALAAAEAEVRLQEALAQQASALGALAALVQRPVEASHVVGAPLLAAPSPSGAVAGTRSDVTAALRGLAAAEDELARARAAAVPPLWIGVFVEKDDGGALVGPYLQWDLPLFDRNQERRGEALGLRREAEGAVRATASRAQVELTTARARVARADEALGRIGDDLGAQARSALADVVAAVDAGELDLAGAIALRGQILSAVDALARLDLWVSEARLDLLLALEDPALLGGP